MIYKIKTSFRLCKVLKTQWEMVDCIEELSQEDTKDIQDKLKIHGNYSGITWDQEEKYKDGTINVRRTFIKIPDRIYEVINTPLSKTVYVQMDNIPDTLRLAISEGKARYDIV